MSGVKYCYSIDEEEYYGDFDSREEALAAGRDSSEGGSVWTGEVRPAPDYLRKWHRNIGEQQVESIDESLADYIASDDAIVELTDEKKEQLGKLIVDFLAEHATFNRWGVADVQEHPGVAE